MFRGAGLDNVNGSVKPKTEGKVDRVLDQLDPNFAAVVLNAVYFKAFWQTSFVRRITADATFNLSNAQPDTSAHDARARLL